MIMSYSKLSMDDSSIYRHYSYLRSTLSQYFQKFVPVVNFNGEIELDEMFLGAKRGAHGRNPAPSSIVFGIFSYTMMLYVKSRFEM